MPPGLGCVPRPDWDRNAGSGTGTSDAQDIQPTPQLAAAAAELDVRRRTGSQTRPWGPAPPGWQLLARPETSPGERRSRRPPKEKRIFISYRRGDCQPQAKRSTTACATAYKPAHIFMDIDSIPPGVDFEEHVRDEIEICDVVLVLIGDDWLSATELRGLAPHR